MERTTDNGTVREINLSDMGLTSQKLVVKESRRARRKATVNFLIDSGVAYSLVPGRILKKLGVRPHRQVDFSLADGSTIRRQVGDAYFELQGEGGAPPVIFGKEGDTYRATRFDLHPWIGCDDPWRSHISETFTHALHNTRAIVAPLIVIIAADKIRDCQLVFVFNCMEKILRVTPYLALRPPEPDEIQPDAKRQS